MTVRFSAELGRTLAGTGGPTYAPHPGVLASDVWRELPQAFRWLAKLFMISVEQGAATTLYCATSPDVGSQTRLYYDRCRIKQPSQVGQDGALAAELWRHTRTWVG